MSGWKNPAPYKQRILVYGDLGTGKTEGLLSWAGRINGKTRIIDTDGAVDVILHNNEKYKDLKGKVEVLVTRNWDEATENLAKVFRDSGPEDLVGIDSMTDLNNYRMDYATEKVTGKNLAEFFTAWLTNSTVSEIKKKGQQGFLIANGVYDLANPLWRGVVTDRVKLPKCHVYMTAHAQDTGHDREDAITKSTYGDFGSKPQTDKNVGFDAASVVLMNKGKLPGDMRYTVVKDWGSGGGERDVKYEDFATAWLFKRNGWRP